MGEEMELDDDEEKFLGSVEILREKLKSEMENAEDQEAGSKERALDKLLALGRINVGTTSSAEATIEDAKESGSSSVP